MSKSPPALLRLSISTIALLGPIMVLGCDSDNSPKKSKRPPKKKPEKNGKAPISEALLRQSCSRCHAFPSPTVLPKLAWAENILKMYEFIGLKGRPLDGFLAEDVIAWYQERAPETIPLRPIGKDQFKSPIEFKARGFAPKGAPPTPGVSSLQLIPGRNSSRPYALLSDMQHHRLMKVEFPNLNLKETPFVTLAKVPYPCRTQVCDIDGDGQNDILVSDLGSFQPMDHDKGLVAVFKVINNKLVPVVLAEGLGRVCDARAADLDGDNDLDVLVSEFGWHESGRLIWLENQTKDWSKGKAKFKIHTIDKRHGVIHTPIADLNNDGKPDFLALFSQEFEEISLFTNEGGRFKQTVLDKAPHPAWGSNNLQLVDLDKDGDLDALVANGDTLDDLLPKNDHGLRWLENKGKEGWKAHDIGKVYGVSGVKTADLDNDGDLDIVASSFLPQFNPARDFPGYPLPSLVWFEQVKKGEFKMWILEQRHPCHPCLDLGDIDLDGDIDIVVGNFSMALQGASWNKQRHWIEVWENPLKSNK